MKKEIEFQFVKDPEYRIVPANGAWGGLTPRGDLKFDLFFEHIDIPEEITYMTTPDGLGPEIERIPNPTPITREAFIGIVMTPENAINLGKWLIEKASQGRQARPEKPKPDING